MGQCGCVACGGTPVEDMTSGARWNSAERCDVTDTCWQGRHVDDVTNGTFQGVSGVWQLGQHLEWTCIS